ncbi:MAG: hypothetical protein FJ202_04045 [Gemmatimonadetes bacterium]|nr:hypothetical protein [Gemmatimonadota bacterium]
MQSVLRQRWRHATAAVLALSLFAGGCKKDATAPEEEEPEVATMRLTINGTTVVNVSENGTVTGTFRIPVGTSTVVATWLKADGSADPIASDASAFRLAVVVPSNANGVAFALSATNNFTGTFTATSNTMTAVPVTFGLFHIAEQHTDFGPFTVPVTVGP